MIFLPHEQKAPYLPGLSFWFRLRLSPGTGGHAFLTKKTTKIHDEYIEQMRSRELVPAEAVFLATRDMVEACRKALPALGITAHELYNVFLVPFWRFAIENGLADSFATAVGGSSLRATSSPDGVCFAFANGIRKTLAVLDSARTACLHEWLKACEDGCKDQSEVPNLRVTEPGSWYLGGSINTTTGTLVLLLAPSDGAKPISIDLDGSAASLLLLYLRSNSAA
jgi:hypothetical protein